MHIILSLLYTIQMFISYMLMLVVMTYNGGLFISVICGFGAGYYIYSAGRHREVAASCH